MRGIAESAIYDQHLRLDPKPIPKYADTYLSRRDETRRDDENVEMCTAPVSSSS
jgi:hypothetical protein